MKIKLTFGLLPLATTMLISCSSVETKQADDETYVGTAGGDHGGVRYETALWSSDPEKKTLPKALGADGKEK